MSAYEQGTRITLAIVTELLHRAVEEKGAGYVYPRSTDFETRCLYVENGAPSCIVGHVLVEAGLPVEVVAMLDTFNGNGWGGGVGAGRLAELPFKRYNISLPAASVLAIAQAEQDAGATWGEAVARALREPPKSGEVEL